VGAAHRGARGQHLGHPVGRLAAAAHRHQAAHDVAHHVVQEGAAVEVEAPVGAAAVMSMRRSVFTGDRRLALRRRGRT
jgi:hypothetical protein